MNRPRSPIEMMVDKACGFDPDAPRPEPEPERDIDAETGNLVEAAEALVEWRLSKKPLFEVEQRMKKAADALIADGWITNP